MTAARRLTRRGAVLLEAARLLVFVVIVAAVFALVCVFATLVGPA